MKLLRILLLLFFALCPSADTHSVQYRFTVLTPGTNFPNFTVVGLLDGEPFVYYDSKIKKLTPKMKEMKGCMYEDLCKSLEAWIQGQEQDMKSLLSDVMKDFNHSEGLHTWQWMVGCEVHNNTHTGNDTSCYDGEHVITLNPQNLTWTPSSDEARALIKHLKKIGHRAVDQKHYLETKCIKLLFDLIPWANKTLASKVPPEVSVIQKNSSSPEVVCLATGFFPKALNITWQKDGEDVHEDVESREMLPNQDGSFQKRIILKVPAEELQKHKYTCVVQHSSLEKELVREVPKGGGSRTRWRIIFPFIAFVIAIITVAVVWRRNSGYRSKEPSII